MTMQVGNSINIRIIVSIMEKKKLGIKTTFNIKYIIMLH